METGVNPEPIRTVHLELKELTAMSNNSLTSAFGFVKRAALEQVALQACIT
jgi:hypothetical protein